MFKSLSFRAVGLLGGILAGTSASADVYNRQILPLGEAEMFMANTGTGRATDGGAVYYNPAGLSDIRGSSISVSGSAYLSSEYNLDNLLSVAGSQTPFQAKSFNTVPTTYVAVKEWGEWHLALSALVPDSSQIDSVVDTTNNGVGLTWLQSYQQSDLWVGLSAGHKIADAWSLGLSVFYIKDNTSQVSSVQAVNTGNNKSVTVLQHTNQSESGISALIGTKWKFSDSLQFGLRLQSPILHVSGKGDVFQRSLTTSGGTVTPSLVTQTDLSANYDLPWDATLGTAYILSDSLTLLFDLSFSAAFQFDSLLNSTFSTHYQGQPTFRTNFGIEFKPSDHIALQGGFLYDPSAIHSLDGRDDGTIRIDYYGITVGLGWSVEHVRTSLGFVYIWASGQALVLASGGQVSPVSVSQMGGLLSTAYLF